MFFDCDWFDPNHGTRENEFGMVEVKHAHRLRPCSPGRASLLYVIPMQKVKCMVGGL
jgi:hypothetical protein